MTGNPLHKALESLQPIDYNNIPTDNLKAYLQEIFRDANLIANSVPHPPEGTSFEESKPHPDVGADSVKQASDLHLSDARSPLPADEHQELWKAWGKPLKIAESSNPLGATVWKMAGHDRHGAWFARRSVHEGMGFKRWKKAMKGEFAASHKVEGGPGAGAVRGIGADKLVVKQEVEGVGSMFVWALSAQFPKPVTSREFVTLLLTTDEGLGEQNDGGRYFIVVSIPVEHIEAPVRTGLVRGTYESVEMVREIPLIRSKKNQSGDKGDSEKSSDKHKSKKEKSKDGDQNGEDDDEDDEAERNPVEWLMVTRSDPGGGIPRFMVERNTPASITADANKFVEWAAKGDGIPSEEEQDIKAPSDLKSGEQQAPAAGAAGSNESVKQVNHSTPASRGETQAASSNAAAGSDDSLATKADVATGGILATMASAVQNGIQSYTPQPVLNHLPTVIVGDAAVQQDYDDDDDDDSSSDSSDASSFESARQYNTNDPASPHRPEGGLAPPTVDSLKSHSDPNLPPGTPLSVDSSAASISSTKTGKKSHHEKELSKLLAKRQALSEKFSAQREKDAQRSKEIEEKTTKENDKKKEKLEKERRKQEDKYHKEMAKIEERQRKEERKVERQRQKELEKDRLSTLEREGSELKAENESLKKQNSDLVRQVGAAQAELTALVREVGLTPGGPDLLERVRLGLGGGDAIGAGMGGGSRARSESRSFSLRSEDRKSG